MRKIKKLVVAALVFTMLLTICACGKNELLGKWEAQDGSKIVFEFQKDGKGKMIVEDAMSVDFTYTSKGDKVDAKLTFMGEEVKMSGTYGKDSMKLDVGGDEVEFTKLK